MKLIQVMLVMFLLSGCIGGGQVDPEVRANDRWQALIAGDWDKAYTFETPAYRKLHSVSDYEKAFGVSVKWRSVQVVEVEKKERVAFVKIDLESVFITPLGGEMPIPSTFTERWLLKEGEWWHVKE